MGDSQYNTEDVRAELRRMCLHVSTADAADAADTSFMEELRALSLQCRPCHSGAVQDAHYYDAKLFGEWELREWVGNMTFNEKINDVWQKIKASDKNWKVPSNLNREAWSGSTSGQKSICVACFAIVLKHTPRFKWVYNMWSSDDAGFHDGSSEHAMQLLLTKGERTSKVEDQKVRKSGEQIYKALLPRDSNGKPLRKGNTNGSANAIFIDDPDMYPQTDFNGFVWGDVRQLLLSRLQGANISETDTDKQKNMNKWLKGVVESSPRWVKDKGKSGDYFHGLKLCNRHTDQVREIWPNTLILDTSTYTACGFELLDGSNCTRKRVKGYKLEDKQICATCLFNKSPEEYAKQYSALYYGKGRQHFKAKETKILGDIRKYLGATDSKSDMSVTVDGKNITVLKYNQKTPHVATENDKVTFFIPDLTILVRAGNDQITKVVVLEVDELQHRTYKLEQEVLRERHMCTALLKKHTPTSMVHIIRFNPDGYKYCNESYPEKGKTESGDLGMYATNAPSTKAVPPSLMRDGQFKNNDDAEYGKRRAVLEQEIKDVINNSASAELGDDMKTYLNIDGSQCTKTYLFYNEGFANVQPTDATFNVRSMNQNTPANAAQGSGN